MQVVKCQTKIKTVIGEIKAIVTAICIRDEQILYEISYFKNGSRSTCWIARYEFEIDVQEKKPAGLVNYEQPNSEECNQVLLLS
jgi:hypothetical protein